MLVVHQHRFLSADQEKSRRNQVPTPAYIESVIEQVKQGSDTGEMMECPICLEPCEDPILTPCAHHACRECILGYWVRLRASYPVIDRSPTCLTVQYAFSSRSLRMEKECEWAPVQLVDESARPRSS